MIYIGAIAMDQIVDKIAALGVPGLVLLVAMAITGWSGAAALTSALALLGGPFGMLGGVAVLGVLSLISKGLAEYGLEQLLQGVVERLRQRGRSVESIAREIEFYPISRGLKLKIRDYLEHLE